AGGRNARHEADCSMPGLSSEQRLLTDRRVSDRRSGVERRSSERRKTLTLVKTERRAGGERRRSRARRGDAERRSGAERRTEETAAEHIRNALQLVAHVAESGALDDELRRDLDAAMVRLRSSARTPLGRTPHSSRQDRSSSLLRRYSQGGRSRCARWRRK